MAAEVLVVEDDVTMRQLLIVFLKEIGYTPYGVGLGREAIAACAQKRPALVLLDIKLPDIDGLEVLRQLKGEDESCKVVVMSSYGDAHTVVEAMKLGAENYLTKPTPFPELRVLIDKLLEVPLEDSRETEIEMEGVIGRSEAMQSVFRMIQRVAGTKATVLIFGESGTGKEVIARAIHMLSPFSGGEFIPVDCTNIPGNLMENELFGHERGAFTDAKMQKKGLLEMADGGTLFLDEIGLMPLNLQAKLLNILETQKFRRVGGMEQIGVSVRFLAATNENLERAVRQGRFREDLYYRLNVVPIELPALRERDDDVLLLADHFLDLYSSLHDTSSRRLAEDAVALLRSYSWPGNVRELRNVMERAVLMADRRVIHAADLSINRPSNRVSSVFKKGLKVYTDGHISVSFPPQGLLLKEVERVVILAALEHTEGNVTQAASLLGISRDTLRYRIAKYELSSEIVQEQENGR